MVNWRILVFSTVAAGLLPVAVAHAEGDGAPLSIVPAMAASAAAPQKPAATKVASPKVAATKVAAKPITRVKRIVGGPRHTADRQLNPQAERGAPPVAIPPDIPLPTGLDAAPVGTITVKPPPVLVPEQRAVALVSAPVAAAAPSDTALPQNQITPAAGTASAMAPATASPPIAAAAPPIPPAAAPPIPPAAAPPLTPAAASPSSPIQAQPPQLATAAPPPTAQGFGEYEPVVHARRAKLGTCMDTVVSESASIIDAKHTAVSTWSTSAPDADIFQSLVGLSYPNKGAPNGAALLVAAPTRPGHCSGMTVQVYPSSQSCSAIQATLIRNGHTLGALQALPLVQTNNGARNLLMPTAGGGCVVVAVGMRQ